MCRHPFQRDPTVAAIEIASQVLGWGLFILLNVLIRRRGKKYACLAVHERGFCVSVRSQHHLCLFDEVESIQVGKKLSPSALAKALDAAMVLKPAHRELHRAMQAWLAEISFLDPTRKRLRLSTAGYEGDDVRVFWQHIATRLPQRVFIDGRPA